MQLQLGSAVRCTDGPFGELGDLVVEPHSRRVTHLVVEPHHHHNQARLVPVELARIVDDAVVLDCALGELERFPLAEEFTYVRLGDLPPRDPDWDVGIETVLAMPSSALPGLAGEPIDYDPHVSTKYDRVPKGEVELRRQSAVVSSDGHHLGHVDSFLVDDFNEQITYLVLERGHLWRRGVVTIPLHAVARIANDEVTLNLSKDEVGAFLRRDAA